MKRKILIKARLLLGALLGFLIILGSALPVEATPTLKLIQGGNEIIVEDGSLFDTILDVGMVGFNGTVGWFTTEIMAGFDPITPGGSPLMPTLSITSMNSTQTWGGHLEIYFTETDYTEPSLGFLGTLEVETSSTNLHDGNWIRYGALYDPLNIAFGGSEFGTTGPLSQASLGNTFTRSFTGAIGGVTPYSLTQFVRVSHPALGTTSFSADLVPIATPEPSALLLMGSGLAGLGLWGWRRKPFTQEV